MPRDRVPQALVMTYMMAAARQGFESAYAVVGPYLHQLCLKMLVGPRDWLYRYSSNKYRDLNGNTNGHFHV
jgi:hypothetical protein